MHTQQVLLPLEKVPQTRPAVAMPSSLERARVQRHPQTSSSSTELALSPMKHRIRSAEGQAAPRVYRGGPKSHGSRTPRQPPGWTPVSGVVDKQMSPALVAPGVHLREAFPAQNPGSRSILQTSTCPGQELLQLSVSFIPADGDGGGGGRNPGL